MVNLRFNKFGTYTEKLAIIIGAIAIMILAWSNLFFHVNMSANAATLDGISNQVEGKVQKDIGATKRAAGDVTGNYELEAKGAMEQAKGSAKQGFGSAENKLDNAKDTVEDKSENLIDSVKDFFD